MATVLVFENDHAFASEVRASLRSIGCVVQVFADASSGMMAAGKATPHLIIVAAELPRVNGFSVCNKLRNDPRLTGVPIIMLSRDATRRTFEQHSRLPTRADVYLSKPIASVELLRHLRRFLPEVAQAPTSSGSQQDEDDSIDDGATVVIESPVDLEPKTANQPSVPPTMGLASQQPIARRIAATVMGQGDVPKARSVLHSLDEAFDDLSGAPELLVSGPTKGAPSPELAWSEAPPSQSVLDEPTRASRVAPSEAPKTASDAVETVDVLDSEVSESTVTSSEVADSAVSDSRVTDSDSDDLAADLFDMSFENTAQSGTEDLAAIAIAEADARVEVERNSIPPSERLELPADPGAMRPRMDSGDVAELPFLRASLKTARQALDQTRTQLQEQLRLTETFRHDLERLKRGSIPAPTNESLRHQDELQERDELLLSLREQVTEREREVVKTRKDSLSSQRREAELNKQLQELESELTEARTQAALAETQAREAHEGAQNLAEQLTKHGHETRETRRHYEGALSKIRESHAAELEAANAAQAEHSVAITAAHDELEKLNAENAILKQDTSKHKAAAKDAEQARVALETQIKENGDELASALADAAKLKKTHETVTTEVDVLKTAAEDAAADFEAQKLENAEEHAQTLRDVEEQNKKALDEALAATDASTAEVTKLTEQVKELEADAERTADLAKASEQKIVQLGEAAEAAVKTAAALAESQRVELSRQTEAQRVEVAELKASLGAAEAEAAATREKLNSAIVQAEEAESAHADAKGQLAAATRELEASVAELAESADEIEANRKALEDATSSAGAAAETISALEDHKTQATQELSDLRKKIDQEQTELSAARTDLLAREATISALEQSQLTLEENVTALEDANAKTMAELEAKLVSERAQLAKARTMLKGIMSAIGDSEVPAAD